MSTFCVAYRGNPGLHGNMDAPAVAMQRGLAVTRSSDTVAKAGAGVIPYGFLDSEVTTDGPNFEEKEFIPETIQNEVKVSVGKISVVPFVPGVEYVMSGNVESGITFAVGDSVVLAADGEITNESGIDNTGDQILGTVQEIDVVFEDVTDAVVWKAEADRGTVV